MRRWHSVAKYGMIPSVDTEEPRDQGTLVEILAAELDCLLSRPLLEATPISRRQERLDRATWLIGILCSAGVLGEVEEALWSS